LFFCSISFFLYLSVLFTVTVHSRIAGDNPLKCVGKDGIINSGQMKQQRKLRAPESHE
jgi:hypothetical protein